ncbi:RloB-like protein [Methylobacter tundripaludum]|uniref:RloB-like protein n=1 Tax=Methylobacter tundripaludum TaxID=173365 RepID=A0A2S6HAT1_9GAMM|nr:RloB family protein [Methylobacter tundripaludum]PPK74604.1 RloB-like protein [Methylobacter tundripaludum]
MSLTQRKSRPLIRDTESLRDDRLFIVACDDTYAPRQYFDFFKMVRVKVHVVETPKEDTSSHATYVLERLQAFEHEEDDERWMLLDTDHCIKKEHIKSFKRALKDARKQGIKIALSRPCFELWLLLHYVDESVVASLKNAPETDAALSQALGVKYDKTKLKQEHYPLASVCEAYRRAEELDEKITGGEIPIGNTSRVYLLWKAILAKSLSSQLPSELRSLLSNSQNDRVAL